MEEVEAIERLKRGDISGLEYLVRRYQVQAVRTAYLVTHDLALAQDVAQAAFLNAYERIGGFDVQRPFGPWFFTSVLRAAVKAARQRDRLVPLDVESGEQDSEALVASAPGPETLGERAETNREIWAALGKLSAEQRAVVIARYYLGMSDAETAAAVAAPLTTIKWRLHSARRRLRLLLEATASK